MNGPLIRDRSALGRVARQWFFGVVGRREALAHATRTGTHVAPALPLEGLPQTVYRAAVNRSAWNTPGTTLTIRLWRKTGPSTRVLVNEGTVDSGPTTARGVTVDPALPEYSILGRAEGEYEVEVETSSALAYSLTLEG